MATADKSLLDFLDEVETISPSRSPKPSKKDPAQIPRGKKKRGFNPAVQSLPKANLGNEQPFIPRTDSSFKLERVSTRAVHKKTNKDRWQLKQVDHGKVMDQNGNVWTPAAKAYKNTEWLSSRRARLLRIMAEYEETEDRMSRLGVDHTILVFCSARGRSREQWKEQLKEANVKSAKAKTPKEKEAADANLLRVQRLEWMCEYYDKTRDLCKLLAEWSLKQPIRFYISSGGGPGLMEAANEGAFRGGMKSVGMGISVPFEPGLNKFVSNDLAFEYHYFFTRKFWMSYPARALIVSPGGFGTCDELFELLTLQQTKKMHDIPVVCLGVEFWKKVLNIDVMVEYGVVSPRDAKRIYFTDDINDAFNHITSHLENFMKSCDDGYQKRHGIH